ncbi:1,5-anhydro-D-fructose reductase [Neolewinella maritima]|uniref:1,5-anhydro-D-fructose reductase n=1 Tax=Neolewinella maritima TaxID=1383882 RepID=A0ABM9B091_9BACT|nr:Gfo/Idh/MocA family oxidoreductase [Neolewinella maritima]CAH1000441.1 1,5-anhydro-D-fructose reductase [Neolewinella maritima]
MVVRFGIVGFGWVARDYMLPALRKHPSAELVAVVSIREEDFNGLPPEIGTYTTVQAMLGAGPLDAVYVASPNHLHAEHVAACAAAGVDILCEKPLAHTYAAAAELVRTVRAADSYFATAFDQRHHPAHRLMQSWVASGRLGTITQARLDYACWLPAGWSANNWRIDRKRAGGGAIIDLAPHGLDLLELLVGQPIEQLQLYQQRVVQDYEVDDGGVLIAKFGGGALGVHSVGYNRPETLPRRRLELIGTRGMLLAENTMGQDPGGRLTFLAADPGAAPQEVSFDQTTSPFYLQLDAFLRDRRGGVNLVRTLDDDIRLAKLLDDALAANPL